jgi:hypothetical protein|eukprot:COSAG01_NODE_13412_length_1588_cov_322.079919_3_plen_68_part_00
MKNWRSMEAFIDERVDVIAFGGIQLEAATKEYFHAAVHGTLAPRPARDQSTAARQGERPWLATRSSP